MADAGNRAYYTFEEEDGSITHVPRVTSVIGDTLAKPALLGYTYRHTRDVIAGWASVMEQRLAEEVENEMDYERLMQEFLNTLTDADELEEVLKENRLRPQDVMEEAADIGTENHATMERLGRIALAHGTRAAVDAARPYLDAEDGHARAIAQWFIDREPTVLASEIKLRSKKYGFAGTCDIVWQNAEFPRTITDLKNRAADLPCAVNHKTEAAAERCHVKGGPYETDYVQVGAYEIAWLEMAYGPDNAQAPDECRRTILIAQADGRYRERESMIPSSTFLDLLSVWKKLRGEE